MTKSLDEIFGDLTDEKSEHKILIVDDDVSVRDALMDTFGHRYDVKLARSGPEAISLAEGEPDICCVVMDIKMPEMNGIEAARRIKQFLPDLPIVFYTGYAGNYPEAKIDKEEQPYDFVTKGQSPETLIRSVRNAVESFQLRRSNKTYAARLESQFGIIGKSLAIQGVRNLIRKAALSDARVMIVGETGTGKELVAQAIHNNSSRREQTLAILNCNHKSPDLVESELFGHVKGAFTGAVAHRVGLFEYADGGTLFLDEIGDLDVTTQAKLLRVLETGEFQRIGEPNVRRSDVRSICATHRDLNSMVETGAFREDIYYRLKSIVINVPALRDRREDIPLLVEWFTQQLTVRRGLPIKIFDRSAVEALIEFHWPGNVRQLMNTIESAIALTDSDFIVTEDVTKHIGTSSLSPSNSWSERRLADKVREYERTVIIRGLVESDYNITRAAANLGVERATLQKKLKGLGISVSNLRTDTASE